MFNEKEIVFGEISDLEGKKLTEHQLKLWNRRIITDSNLGDINKRTRNIISDFNAIIVHKNKTLPTITANGKYINYETPNNISDISIIKGGSFPMDYNFLNNKPGYLIGMSVPPAMVANIATEIYNQWLSKL